MDCEKFDTLIIDELYGELDEVTRAAMRRHASGCPRCDEKLRGLRATKELVRLQAPELPAGLEDRILTATSEAVAVAPLARGRAARLLSLAGSWAMRPQTAMAALFLLMIGSSALLLRSRQPRESAALTVTQEGTPTLAAAEEREPEKVVAAAAPPAPHPPPPVVAAGPAQAAAANEGPLALAEDDRERKKDGRAGSGAAATATPLAQAPGAAPPPAAGAKPKSQDPSAGPRGEGGDPFAAGMSAYQARRYGEATPLLDEAAGQGNSAAPLWAARSVRDGSGCAAALPRLDALAAKGGTVGHDALWDSARCRDSLGDHEGARARYRTLLSVPSYAARAQAALDSTSEMASRKAATQAPATSDSLGGARQAPGKAAAPPRPAPAVEQKGAY